MTKHEISDIYSRFKWTPSMTHWRTIKEEATERFGEKNVVLYQVGSFYESYFHDAKEYSESTGAILTRKDKSDDLSAPMSGSPLPVLEEKVKRLVEDGFAVVVVSEGEGKDGEIVRKISSVQTPATRMAEGEKTNCACGISLSGTGDEVNIAVLDPFSSDFVIASFKKAGFPQNAIGFISGRSPSEIVGDENLASELVSLFPDMRFINGFHQSSAEKAVEKYVISILPEREGTFGSAEALILDENRFEVGVKTLANIEAITNGNDRKSLARFLTRRMKSPHGRRTLLSLLRNPFKDAKTIAERHEMTKELTNDETVAGDAAGLLADVPDIIRLGGKAFLNSFHPSEARRVSLFCIKASEFAKSLGKTSSFYEKFKKFISVPEVFIETAKTVLDFPSAVGEPGIFSEGHYEKIDEINKRLKTDEVFKTLEEGLSMRSGTKTKILHNKDGIFAETKPGTVASVPEGWKKERSVKAADRFRVPALDSLWGKLLSANEELCRAEAAEFLRLRMDIAANHQYLAELSETVSLLDLSFLSASCVSSLGWNFPSVSKRGTGLVAENLFHPVASTFINGYVKNDLDLNTKKCAVVCGPNMGGKSMYLKSSALCALLAHCGLPVPAKRFSFELLEGIFVRAGSGDDFAEGKSTFYTEMAEIAEMLASAGRCFFVMDEVGRGTDAEEGEALALAIVNEVSGRDCPCLVSTHYRKLAETLEKDETAIILHADAKMINGSPVFTHKILPGIPAIKGSLGIEIASSAGLPKNVILAARKILKND